jgi:hypothetical protein
MVTTPTGPKFVKNNDQSGARSGDHTQKPLVCLYTTSSRPSIGSIEPLNRSAIPTFGASRVTGDCHPRYRGRYLGNQRIVSPILNGCYSAKKLLVAEPHVDGSRRGAHSFLMPEIDEQVLIAGVERRPANTYSEIAPDRPSSAIGNAYKQFEQSPIRDFVPLLVERKARAELEKGPIVDTAALASSEVSAY